MIFIYLSASYKKERKHGKRALYIHSSFHQSLKCSISFHAFTISSSFRTSGSKAVWYGMVRSFLLCMYIHITYSNTHLLLSLFTFQTVLLNFFSFMMLRRCEFQCEYKSGISLYIIYVYFYDMFFTLIQFQGKVLSSCNGEQVYVCMYVRENIFIP